jgi:hypothetical protein
MVDCVCRANAEGRHCLLRQVHGGGAGGTAQELPPLSPSRQLVRPTPLMCLAWPHPFDHHWTCRVDTNLAMWKEMLVASETGVKTCLRAKIDYKSTNGALRDPVLYRCKPEPHVRYAASSCVFSCALQMFQSTFSFLVVFLWSLLTISVTLAALAPSSRSIPPTISLAPLWTALKA